jgi:CheY-like chemotaxis protein
VSKILVIEDDGPLRNVLRDTLLIDGHEVAEASTGREGVERFGIDPPALVVVDLALPDLHGWETLREIRRHTPEVPFIVMSGGGLLEGLQPGRPGILDSSSPAQYRLLRKPFPLDVFSETVRDLLARADAGS